LTDRLVLFSYPIIYQTDIDVASQNPAQFTFTSLIGDFDHAVSFLKQNHSLIRFVKKAKTLYNSISIS